MSKRPEDDGVNGEQLKARVYQGLQKRKCCALCLQSFYVDELPGAITYKSILELRQKWGVDIRKGNRLPTPSQLYQRAELCIFCMQFFDVDSLDAAESTPPLSVTAMSGTSMGGSPTQRSLMGTAGASQVARTSSPARK
jgi:hypothetical protein